MGKAFKSVGKIAGGAAGGLLGGVIGGKAGGAVGGGGQQGFATLAQRDPNAARKELKRDISEGQAFGKSIVGDGDLGRLGTSTDLQAVLDVRRQQLGGLTGAETQGLRDESVSQINRSTEGARRRLAGAQARSGVSGGIAAQQQGDVINQGIQATGQFERDLLLKQREAQTSGANALEGTAKSVESFDLAQAAREKQIQLDTGLAFGQIGSAERSGQAANVANVASANAQKSNTGLLGGVLGK